MKIIKKKAKSIFTKSKLPGCDYVINHYVGCGHACVYCYANSLCQWLFRMRKQKSSGKWGSWVEVKENAPELVKGKKIKGLVWMSSISDPYQPIEKKLKLTRKILKNLDKSTDLAVQTKSDLILRDLDLLRQFKKLEIGFTINGFRLEIKKLFEPYSSSHKKRIRALKILKKNGVKTYAFVSPIIPYLVKVEQCIHETKDFVDFYFFEILNLRGAGKNFESLLKNKFPKSYEKMINQKKFDKFIKEIRGIIKKANIETSGIIIHYPKFKIVKI